jgi:hypothetical protein
VSAYGVRFGDPNQAVGDAYDVVEITKAPTSWHNPPAAPPTRIHHDGTRLVLPLGPAHTADDTYSTTEVASSPRFDQDHLDGLLAEGSRRIMTPGRQAVFSDVVFSEHFGDGRAATETVTAGVNFQSWRGIDHGAEHAAEHGQRPAFMGVSVLYMGGPGVVPAVLNRSRRRRGLVATVVDFNVGLQWVAPLPDVDPVQPHDYVLRWHPDRSVTFLVDGQEVASYADGPRQLSPFKFYRRYRKGIDLVGHRRLTADPCHIDAWINCSRTGNTPDVFCGQRFAHDMHVALGGFAIEPCIGTAGNPLNAELG